MYRGGMILLLVSVLLLSRCTQAPVSGGGGASETVATVKLHEKGLRVSVTGDGTFSVRAAVYHSDFSLADTGHFSGTAVVTDESPEWYVPMLSDSVFNVYVIDTVNTKGVHFLYDNRANSLRGPQTKTLSALGGISGGVTVTSRERGDTTVPVGERVVVPGSAFSAIVGENGMYHLSGLPEATYSIKLDFTLKSYTRTDPSDTVTVSGDRISTFDLNVDN